MLRMPLSQLMTEAACIAWNAVVRRRTSQNNKVQRALSTIQFRGKPVDLVEDYSHIWGRKFEHEENRILSHFEKLLREWAATNDGVRLNEALDCFAIRNSTSLMWTVLMEAGAEHPSALGVMLGGVLDESLFLTYSDYAYGGTALLGALHKTGNVVQRKRLEKLIFDLPKNARLMRGEPRKPIPSWVEYAQNRLLGMLDGPNIVRRAVQDLRRARQAKNTLPSNVKKGPPSAEFIRVSNEERLARHGISPKEPANNEMLHLCEELKPFLGRDNNKVDAKEVERNWSVIQRCENALKRNSKHKSKMAEELWGHLVGACENIARQVPWPKTSKRWKTVRRILLKASVDPMPKTSDGEDTKVDRWHSWGWPSPRLDAARGLTFLAYRLGHADKAVTSSLRRLSSDKFHPLRINLAERLNVLEQPSPDLMWKMIDMFIARERKFSVLDALLHSMDRLWEKAPEKVMPRLRRISDRAIQDAPADNSIHETLAHTHLFHFLRTGDSECEAFIDELIGECDNQRRSHALGAQLHTCRQGGWLTAGDAVKSEAHADEVRKRTWILFSKLLAAAQTKLRKHRETLHHLHEHGRAEPVAVKPIREKLDGVARLVNSVAAQLYFASGALDKQNSQAEQRLTPPQSRRFWQEAAPLFSALSAEPHPKTAHYIVQTMNHLLPYAPREVFLLATQSIRSSATAGFQHESLAVREVVNLIQRALADHRELFKSDSGQESECLTALLQVLDLFVEAGWAEARQLTHRLEEIYR